MINEAGFKSFLESQGIEAEAIATRIQYAKEAETILGRDLDSVVIDDGIMYDALLEIKENADDTAREKLHGGVQNAVRKYYEYKNGRVFPRLSEYARESKNSFYMGPIMVNQISEIEKRILRYLSETHQIDSQFVTSTGTFRPYEVVAHNIGYPESETLYLLDRLSEKGLLERHSAIRLAQTSSMMFPKLTTSEGDRIVSETKDTVSR